MNVDLATEFDIVARLVVAAVLGALIGLEREIHEHPAGMRTHLLVSLGSAAFTVLSIHAFQAPGADPARIAAQIVAGVGFLGAGAILKEGATIRGLTTAASLWSVAAVGMAAGAGSWVVAITATVLVLLSLGPLRLVAERFVGREQHRVTLQLVAGPQGLGRVVTAITESGGTIGHLASNRTAAGDLSITVEFRAQDVGRGSAITVAVADLDGVDLLDSRIIGD
ncbi:hypothetical protein BH20CHL7_BH20CHL7_04990 [soil metagenome]